MDYIDFCKKYYATTKIPISLLLGTAEKYSTIGELFSVEPLTDYPVLAGGPNWGNFEIESEEFLR